MSAQPIFAPSMGHGGQDGGSRGVGKDPATDDVAHHGFVDEGTVYDPMPDDWPD
jgi:hypothetical protein